MGKYFFLWEIEKKIPIKILSCSMLKNNCSDFLWEKRTRKFAKKI